MQVNLRARTAAAALLIATNLIVSRAADPPFRLVDVAKESGVVLLNIAGTTSKNYLIDSTGNGAAFFDYDRDGDMDVLIVNGSSLSRFRSGGDQMVALYRNDGGGHFTDVTAKSGLGRRGWGMGVCIADYDNDGFDDVYVTAWGPNMLFHNNGNGTFTDVTRTAGVGDRRWGTGCAFGDYDRDGKVDLYVANYVAFDEQKIPRRGEGCQYMTLVTACGPRNLPGDPDVLY